MSNYSQVFIQESKDSAKHYKARRTKLQNALKIPILLTGIPESPTKNTPWAHPYSPIHQDPNYLYLTGINQANTAIYITEKEEILFLPNHDPKTEFWDGHRLSIGDKTHNQKIKALTGFNTLKPIKDLDKFRPSSQSLATLWYQKNNLKVLKDHNHKQKQKLAKNHTLTNIAPTLYKQRLPLDNIQIKNLKTAIEKTKTAYESTLKTLSKAKTETELSGTLIGNLLKETSHGLSFNPIVAGGKNAGILHYIKNDSPLNKKDLLLIDFGLKYNNIVTDISRTVPISGEMSPLQKILYNIVLDTQQKVEAATKPNTTIETLNKICLAHMNSALKAQITEKGGTMNLDYKTSPHNVSHLIGIEVHDGDPFGEYRNTLKLAPNMLISNEPGLYGTFTLKINGKTHKETLGIRIEDMLLITRTGCKNLSKSIPKHPPSC